jgi:hypothetical protein
MSSLQHLQKEIAMSHQKRLVISIALIASLLVWPFAVSAQSSSKGNWDFVRNLAADSKVSVKLKTGKKVDGHFKSASDSLLTLTTGSGPVDLKRDEIASVYEVRRKSATKSAMLGMGIGAGAGAALGAAGSANDDNGFDQIDHAIIAGLVVVGAVAGSVTGYFVGRRAKRTLIYENK